MGGYIGSSVGNVANAAERKQTYSITTATTSLTGLAYTPTKVHVFHNGVRLVDNTDYTATNGTSITLTNAAQNGDEVVVISYPSFQVSDTVSAANGGTFSGNIATSGTLGVTGTATLSGNTTVGGTFGSTGLITASAGVAIGGTGAANTLDDYEEGTWVPVIKDTSGGSAYTYSTHYEFRLPGSTSSTNALPYTKIGNRVFITFAIWWNTTATTRYNISLPFAYDGSEYGITGAAVPYSIAADQGLGILGAGGNGSSFDTFIVSSSGGHAGVPHTGNSEVYYFVCYQTA